MTKSIVCGGVVCAGVCLMVIMGLYACCGSGGCSDPIPSTANYFPTTQDSIWNYLNTKGTTTYTSIILITQSTSSSFSGKSTTSQNTDYVIADYILLTNGAWGCTKQTPYNASGVSQYSITLSPPWQVVPSAWTIGSQETSTTTSLSSYGSYTISVDMTIIGLESITVPAGTFNNTVKVATTTTSQGHTTTDALWFADGVGVIKSVSSSASGTNTTELTSYTIH